MCASNHQLRVSASQESVLLLSDSRTGKIVQIGATVTFSIVGFIENLHTHVKYIVLVHFTSDKIHIVQRLVRRAAYFAVSRWCRVTGRRDWQLTAWPKSQTALHFRQKSPIWSLNRKTLK